MDRLVYTALSGLRGHLSAQAAIANNLANASTVGFKAEKIDFEALTLRGGGSQLETRSPTSEAVKDADRSAGAVISTANPLDVAINGDAWMAVQATDGTEGYTRRGDLQITPSGVLQTGDGFPVIGAGGGPITIPPNDGVTISGDGSILIVPIGESADRAQALDKIKLVSTEGSQTLKGMDNLLKVVGGGTLPEDMNATVQSGALEQSNVNMTTALVDMIENQRSYEVAAKLLSTTQQMDESGAQLMRLPS